MQEDEELEAEMGVVLENSTPQHPLERALQLLEKHDAASAAKMLENHIGAGTSRRRQLAATASRHAAGVGSQLREEEEEEQLPAAVQQEP